MNKKGFKGVLTIKATEYHQVSLALNNNPESKTLNTVESIMSKTGWILKTSPTVENKTTTYEYVLENIEYPNHDDALTVLAKNGMMIDGTFWKDDSYDFSKVFHADMDSKFYKSQGLIVVPYSYYCNVKNRATIFDTFQHLLNITENNETNVEQFCKTFNTCIEAFSKENPHQEIISSILETFPNSDSENLKTFIQKYSKNEIYPTLPELVDVTFGAGMPYASSSVTGSLTVTYNEKTEKMLLKNLKKYFPQLRYIKTQPLENLFALASLNEPVYMKQNLQSPNKMMWYEFYETPWNRKLTEIITYITHYGGRVEGNFKDRNRNSWMLSKHLGKNKWYVERTISTPAEDFYNSANKSNLIAMLDVKLLKTTKNTINSKTLKTIMKKMNQELKEWDSITSFDKISQTVNNILLLN